MPSQLEILEELKHNLVISFNDLVTHLPDFIGALLLLLVGWLAARLVRYLSTKLLLLLNRSLERLFSGRSQLILRFSSGMIRLVSTVLFWITLFVFTTAALRVAGLIGIAQWLERIVDYLPSLVTGGFIILVGYVLSSVVKDATLAAARSAALAEADLVSLIAQGITFITALIIGMEQIGVDVTFLTTIVGVSIAALLAGFALAFGIGARTLVGNLIAAYYMRELLEPGQKVRIGEHEGKVLKLSATTIILDTAEGRTSIPASCYQQQPVLVLIEDEFANE